MAHPQHGLSVNPDAPTAAFKGAAFARFIAGRTEFVHIRTRRRSPGQNGVRERAFGSLKYERLYRIEIDDLPALAREAEHYRHSFNHVRPHQTLSAATGRSRSTPIRVRIPNSQTQNPEPIT